MFRKQEKNVGFAETKLEIFEATKKIKLLSHAWFPDGEIKAIFLGIHGGLAHAGDWVTPALYFKQKNIATYALDLRYHGTFPQYNKNSKNFFHINSYDDYVHDIHKYFLLLRQQYPKTPIFVLAHSNGALIALRYGLTKAKDTDIKGFIISSPWLKNLVSISPLTLAVSKLIAKIYPTFAISPPSLSDVLTHDPQITARHHADEVAGLRGTKVSAKLGVESLKTQEWVKANIKKWGPFPIFAAIAGKDQLADPKVNEESFKKISPELLKMTIYPENYHENFNELNREQIFADIYNWCQQLI